MTTIVSESLRTFGHHWRRLFVCDILYKLITTILLVPLLLVLFRLVIFTSGETVLSDLDLILLCVRPLSLFSLIIVGSFWFFISALEQTSLLAVSSTTPREQSQSMEGTIRFAISNIWPVFKLTSGFLIAILIITIPFLVASGCVYFLLLTEFDINYYLKVKPTNFWIAVGIGALLTLGLLICLLRLATNWIFALPILLFEKVPPAEAIRQSKQRARGNHWRIVLPFLSLALSMSALTTVSAWLIISLGRFLVPLTVDSMGWLTFTIGGMLLLWGGTMLFMNLIGTTLFSSLHFILYRQYSSQGVPQLSYSEVVDASTQKTTFRFTPKKILFGIVAGIVVSSIIGLVVIKSVRSSDDVTIIAHRGASKTAPENTLAAVREAIEEGADIVEIDVQETADDQVVVFHDSDFMKLAGKKLTIWDATMPELEKIDIGSWFGPQFKEERVPTLAAVLKECKDKIHVLIELKYYGHDKDLEQRVIDIVEAAGMVDQVMLMSLNVNAVKKVKSIRPTWKAGLLLSVSAGNLKKLNVDFLAVNGTFATPNFIQEIHRSGKQVFVWTINDSVSMSNMISRGVDGIITDKPDLAKNVLAFREHLSVPERLLLELAGIFGVKKQILEQ